MIPTNAIIIRLAREDDTRTLDRLAALDSRPPLAGPALIAEQDGVARAALELPTGRAIADPFFRTADLVELLTMRARRLSHDTRPVRPSRRSRLAGVLRRPTRAQTV